MIQTWNTETRAESGGWREGPIIMIYLTAHALQPPPLPAMLSEAWYYDTTKVHRCGAERVKPIGIRTMIICNPAVSLGWTLPFQMRRLDVTTVSKIIGSIDKKIGDKMIETNRCDHDHLWSHCVSLRRVLPFLDVMKVSHLFVSSELTDM